MNLPNIEHATANKTPLGATEIRMDSDWIFYDLDNYVDFMDEEGKLREPLPEEICYFRFICFAPSITAAEIEARLVVVAEADIPKNQIFGR